MEHSELELQLVKQQYQLAQAVIELSKGVALQPILRHVGEIAMELTGAHYAMLSYVEDGKKIFIPLGMSEDELGKMDREPQGLGLLGLIWNEQEVVRVGDISRHASSVGFPANHPVMSTFLGAPIKFGDEVEGAIYLTEKQDGHSFTPLDENIVRTLASACAVAISNATNMQRLRDRNAELERLLEEGKGS